MTAHASTCPLDHVQVGEGVPCQLPWLPHGPVWGDSTGRLLDDGDDDDCNLFEILFNHRFFSMVTVQCMVTTRLVQHY